MGSGGGRASRFRHGGGGRAGCRGRRNGAVHSHGHWGDVSELASSGDDVYDGSSSSSEGIGKLKRKRVLDDALFDFFSKQGIKSLKRNFSNFIMESDVWRENKRPKSIVPGKDSFHSYGAKYFFEVLSRLTADQKAIIEKFGFGCLLNLSKTYLPSSFIWWLAARVDPICSEIVCDDKTIHISKDAFHFILGLPNSGSHLVENSDGGLQFILSLFHLSEAPHITFFGDKLNSKEPFSDQEVFVCFMEIAVSCFLCPSDGLSLNTKYIEQLGDPERARSFDICMLVYNQLMHGVMKFVKYIKAKGRKPKFFEFCSYGLAVYYLDCLDFGVHIAGSGSPRSVSWRGDMIKIYSELDRKGRAGFGRRRLRKDLASCYSNGDAVKQAERCVQCGSHFEQLSALQNENMHEQFGMIIYGKTIDGILEIVQSYHSAELDNSRKADTFVHDLLQFLAQARPWYSSASCIQKEGSHPSRANLSASNDRPADYIEETPASFANKTMDRNSIITAPMLPPVAKVRSKLAIQVPGSCQQGICQADLVSPIGRMKLSPVSGGKDGSKLVPSCLVNNPLSKCQKGSQIDPIPVGDITPKATLVQKSPDLIVTGTSSFKQRQSELAMATDAMYNKSVHGKAPQSTEPVRKVARSYSIPPEVVEIGDDYVGMEHGFPNPLQDTSAPNKLIILQPKNTLALPLAPNPRFPVSDDDACTIAPLLSLHTLKIYRKTMQSYIMESIAVIYRLVRR